MTKKIILSTIAVTAILAASANASVADRVFTLEKIIIKQQKEINSLKENSLGEDVEDLDSRLGIIETRSFTDKIQLGLGMRGEVNSVSTTYANDTTPVNEDPIWRTKLNINMKSKIADNLKFTGRLGMYKNWGDSNTDAMAMASMDAKQARTPDNTSTLYVERAYLDWAMNPDSTIPVYMTLGRQPSSDGPSYQIKEGTSRKGTYDALAFDGAADGIVFTANLNQILPGTTSFRVAYGVPNNGSDYNSANMTDTKVTGVFLDKTFNSIKQDHLIQIYTVNAKDLMGNPALGSADKNIGDLDITGAMFEIQNVAGFDFFAHYATNTAKPNGNTVDLSGIYGAGYNTLGLLSSTSSTTQTTGNAVWTGIQYTFNKEWAIGAEYNKGSENWFSFTFASNDPMNKLATRGTATEVYITKAINKFANFRLGHVAINYDYTGSGSWLGAPMSIDNPYAAGQIKEKTNTYLTFNVLF